MLDLTHRAQRLVHEEAAFAPAFRVPGYRLAHWPWVRFPKDFDVRSSDEVYTYGLFWLEPGQREPELAAFRAGTRKGEPRSEVYDRWRAD
jgi:microcin C transport system substrate-binding protein